MISNDSTTYRCIKEVDAILKLNLIQPLTVSLQVFVFEMLIDRFTVVCLVAWPLNESEVGVNLVLIETSLLFIWKFLLISMRTASLT